MRIKSNEDKDNGLLVSLCEVLGVLTAYVMVFYLLWEGVLAMAGAK